MPDETMSARCLADHLRMRRAQSRRRCRVGSSGALARSGSLDAVATLSVAMGAQGVAAGVTTAIRGY